VCVCVCVCVWDVMVTSKMYGGPVQSWPNYHNKLIAATVAHANSQHARAAQQQASIRKHLNTQTMDCTPACTIMELHVRAAY
jgi:hypothetical protein